MNDNHKGIIRYVHRRDRLRSGKDRFRWKHIVRNINDVQLAREESSPPTWDNHSHRWATGRIWRLYKGIAKMDHVDNDVRSWSFDDLPPLAWGYNSIHPYNSGDLSAWMWLHLSDVPDMDRFMSPLYSDAAHLIRRHLTEKEYGTLFDDLIFGRCPKCFYSLGEYRCEKCGWENDQ